MEHLWLDPAEFRNHESIGDWVPSPDGEWVAYATHPQGADEAIMHVRRIATNKEDPHDNIPGANFADVSWSADSQGFYYMRLPMNSAITSADRVAQADVRFHALGQDPAHDASVYPPTHDASEYLTPQVSADGRWLFVITDSGWSSNTIDVSGIGGPALRFTSLYTSTSTVAQVTSWKDYFYLRTDQDAPHGKVARKKPSEESWETIIPERPNVTIESMRLVGGYLVLTVLQNAASAVEVYRLNGHKIWQVPIPADGRVREVSGREDRDILFIDYESFFVPPCIYRAELSKCKLDLWEKTKLRVDPEPFKTESVWFASRDGTPVSMMIVCRKDLVRSGRAPVLMEGYGGFNTPILPHFSPETMVWLEMGGVLAVPHLRGGGEYGEAWHRAGMLTHKQNTFDDFTAAADYLIKKGYTRPNRLAIQGVSNGGLLVAAATVQRTGPFRAVICKNPLTDMVRYPFFGEGNAWVPEYGSPDKPAELAALQAYSPYHHVKPGKPYPSLFMVASENDDRVDPMHARKFTAALQAATISKNPILFRLLPNAGHSNSDLLTAQVQETAERILFLRKELGALVKCGGNKL